MAELAELAGLVLAGGASRRMGRDKAHVMINKKTLAATMMEKLRTAGCNPVLLSGKDGIADIYPGKGPLAGMHAAFGQTGAARAMVIVPVDMPALGIKNLKTLCEAPGEAVLYKGQSLPLKLALNARIYDRLEEVLTGQNADLSIRAFVSGLDVRVLSADRISAQELTNVNTPTDLKNWEESCETQA